MNIFKKIRIVSIVLVSFIIPFSVFIFLLNSNLSDIIFINYKIYSIIFFVGCFIAFYGSYLYYRVYTEKRNIRDFMFSIAFVIFGLMSFIHAIAIFDRLLFNEVIFDIFEYYSFFLTSVVLFLLAFLNKGDFPKIYNIKITIFSFFIISPFIFLFLLVSYPSLGEFLGGFTHNISVITALLFFIFLVVRIVFTLRGVAIYRPFLLAGVAILINVGIIPLFYQEWNLLWWLFHLVFLVGFLFILLDFLKNREFDNFRIAFLNASLSTKLTIFITSVLFLFFVIITFIAFRMSGELMTKYLLDDISGDIKNSSLTVNKVIESVLKDIEFIKQSPIFNSGIIDEDKINYLNDFLSSIIFLNSIYSNIIYIDNNGNEVVRIDSRDLKPYIIPKNELKNKKDSNFFYETMNTSKEDTYVSDFSLRRESDSLEIEMPYNPIIRYATPIFDLNNNKIGIIVININGKYLISEIVSSSQHNEKDFFIVNEGGFYIKSNNVKKDWSSEANLNTGWNIKSDMPASLTEKIYSSDAGSFLSDGYLVSYNKIYYSSGSNDKFLILGVLTSEEEAMRSIIFFRSKMLSIGFLIVIIAILFSYIFIRKIFLPIKELSDITQRVIKGEKNIRAEVLSSDEVGKLSSNFNKMIDSLMNLNVTLENKVKERTMELDRKIIQVEHQVSETKKFQQAVESSTDGIVILNKKGVVTFSNKTFENITGYGFGDMFGRNFKSFLGDKTKRAVLDKIEKTIVSGSAIVIDDILGEKGDYKYNLELSLYPVILDRDDIKFFVGIFQDITKKKLIDKAKTEFVSLASHQLRTPLSIINWRVEMLMDGDAGKLNKKQKLYLNDVYSGSKRMVDLVNSFLSVSKLELGNIFIDPEDLSLEETCNYILSEIAHKIEKKKLNVKKKFAKNLPLISADKKLIMVIFQNLLSNAIKYTQNEGNIKIEIKKDKSNFLIKVTDNGFGIPQEQQDKVFTKLFRADNAREKVEGGTGLGLYIVKSILDTTGGKIWFESELDKGSTFYVELPLTGMKKTTE
ncbi:MAG: ATP-binding protein [Patescibacteria group bacterium]